MIYLLDTNVFIHAANNNYPFDVFPGFWTTLVELAKAGKVASIEQVRKEIVIYKDELSAWCKNNLPDSFFIDEDIFLEYSQLIKWAQNALGKNQRAFNRFSASNNADTFLVAFALKHLGMYKLVTKEISDVRNQTNFKIPDVCNSHSISWTNTVGMLRELKISF